MTSKFPIKSKFTFAFVIRAKYRWRLQRQKWLRPLWWAKTITFHTQPKDSGTKLITSQRNQFCQLFLSPKMGGLVNIIVNAIVSNVKVMCQPAVYFIHSFFDRKALIESCSRFSLNVRQSAKMSHLYCQCTKSIHLNNSSKSITNQLSHDSDMQVG